jgi:formate C-acetyltransferase
MQIDLDPSLSGNEESVERIIALIRGHFELGGTQINFNILDREKLAEAYEHPERYPDLTVRVTGFSVYFSSLSQEMRKLVLDRVICN